MTNLDRHTFPPGGWQFRQSQTNWTAPTPLASTFDQVVQQIIAMRKKNPAITAKHKLATNSEAVASELERFTRKRLGLSEEATPVPFPVSRSLPQESAVAAAVDKIKKLAAGAALLTEWEATGMAPVAQEVAESRATICVNCPKNDKGGSLSEWFTIPAANLIRHRIARLHDMKLVTSVNDQLNVCTACDCPLPLKVFCPPDLITKRLKPEQKAALHPDCWILKL